MKVVPPSPPTRVGSSRTCWRSPLDEPLGDGRRSTPPAAAAVRLAGRLGRGADDELDLDAVADDAGQRLADQRAIARLEPVLGEAVRDGDPEALLIDVDQLGVAQPRLEIGRRERDLELSQGGSPDLLCVHSSMGSCGVGGRLMGSVGHGSGSCAGVARCSDVPFAGTGLTMFPRIRVGLRGAPAYVSGAEGPERIAPPGRAPQGDSGILPGSIDRSAASADARPASRPAARLTPFSGGAYHPPDDDAPCAFGRQARLRAFRG